MKAVAVSGAPSAKWDLLSDQIENLGIALSHAHTDDDLAPLAAELGNPPVIVYNPEGSDEARQVLDWARRQPIKRPIVVLVEQSNFAQYQECMHQGASAYYEVSAEPERIAQVIRRAAGETGI